MTSSPAADDARQIELVLFDLDDTLVDHGAAATAALAHAVGRWSPNPSAHDLDQLHRLWQQIERDEYDAYLRGECTHAEQRLRRLRRFFPVLEIESDDDSYLTTQFQHYLDAYVAAWRLFDDVRAALDELDAAGLRIGVLTNGDPRQQRLKLERSGLPGRFDQILTPTEVGVPKPAAAAFVTACTMLGAVPARSAYVGDNLEVDAVGAAAAGLHGIWLDRSDSDATVPQGVTRITSLAALSPALR